MKRPLEFRNYTYSEMIVVVAERDDLKAKLAQTTYSESAFEKLSRENGTLRTKLAQVEATAQRRLELLRQREWTEERYESEATGFHRCQICSGMKEIHGHQPTCPLAAELREDKP